MKKIFIAIMAVAAAVSCSQELTVDAPKGAAIGFANAFVENSTRVAKDLTKGDFDFGVYGTVANESGNALIFTNQPVAKDGTYSPAQYWVANATYTFTAYAPKTGAQWAYAPAKGTDSEAYNGTLSFDNAAALGEQDLLFAAATRTTPASITAAPEAVGLTFGHLLSKVAFKFTNVFTDKNISLNVYDVKINNTAATGTLPVENGVTGVWTGNGDYVRAFGAATADKDAALANTASLTTEHFYLIPVERAYNITFKVGLYQAGVLLNTYEHTIDAIISLEKGKSYCLNATLAAENVNPDTQLFPIEFKVDDVEDWTEDDVTLVAPTKVATATDLRTALEAGQNVVLTADINLDEDPAVRAAAHTGLKLDNDVVIDGAGKTISTTAVRAIVIDGAKNVVLKNFTLNAPASQRGIQMQATGHNVTIENIKATSENRTINITDTCEGAVVAIKNCELKGLTPVNVWGKNNNVTVKDTKITLEDNNTTEGYAAIYNAATNNSLVTLVNTNITITGTAAEDTLQSLIANENTQTVGIESAYHYYAINYPSSDRYTYATFEEAYADAEDGETIVVIKDVTTTNTAIKIKKKITLDLNGKTVKTTADNQDAIWVLTDGDLTIVGEGNVVSEESYSVYAGGTGKLTINGGNYESVISAVYAQSNAQVVINGGSFKANDYTNSQGDSYGQNYTLNLKDGSNASILVNAGSFYKFNPAQSLSENPQANFVAAGKTVEQDGDWYIVK